MSCNISDSTEITLKTKTNSSRSLICSEYYGEILVIGYVGM